MAKIQLKVIAETKTAETQINTLKNNIESAFSKPIQIKVEASGLDAVNQTLKEMSAVLQKSSGKDGAAEAVNDLTDRVDELTAGMRIAKQTITEFSDAETKTAKQYTDDVNKMVTVTEQGNKTVIQSTEKFAKVLSDEEKSMHTSAVRAKAANDAYGELIDTQEKMVDGQVVQAVNKYRDSLGNVTTVTAKLKGETVEVSTVTRENSEQMKKQADAAELAAKKNTLLGDSLDRIIAKIIAWQVINAAVASVIRSFREALETMKAVDQELINIQKVSDLTAVEIKQIGDAAYDTASKYGIAADEYLKAVYTFQKAGLGDSATAMAELATKTMLVGDTTAEVASQFLISANAAWKLGGDVKALSAIVDEADKLNNSYAVSLSDIAEGLPIVGATAAQVGMSAEQTMAAISTIVASTGQSATKAATALRAIIMNLVGETGELDDGLEVTSESIDALDKVMLTYAEDAVKAAKATGTIVDPMEAIAALAQAAQDGLLNEAELFEVLSGLGGKLRTTQLTALVNNMDMYQSMLADTANAAGTADKEIGTMLDSWNAKTQILQNTWTQLISHIVDTDLFKTAVDVLTEVLKILDNDFGRTTITVLAFSGAIAALITNIPKLAATIMGGGLIKGISALITAIGSATTATEVFSAVWAASPFLVISVAIGTVYALTAAINGVYHALGNKTVDEHLEKMSAAVSEYENATSELDKLNQKIETNNRLIEESNKAGGDDAYQTRLESENEALKDQIFLLRQRQKSNAFEAATEAIGVVNGTYSFDYGMGMSPALMGLEAYYNAIKGNEEYADSFNDLTNNLIRARDALYLYKDLNGALTAEQQDALSLLISLVGARKSEEKALKEQSDTTDDLNAAITTQVALYTELKAKLDPLNAAMTELTEQGYMTEKTMQALIEKYPELANSIVVTKDGFVLNTKAITDNVSALWAEYAAINGNAAAASFVQILALNSESTAWAANTAEIKKNLTARIAALEAESVLSVRTKGGTALGINVEADEELTRLKALLAALNSAPEPIETETVSSSGTGESKTDEKLEALKETVALEKQRLAYMEASGASAEEQAEQMRVIQDALHDEAEYLRAIEGESKNVVALSTEWWNYQSKIEKSAEETAKALREDIAATMKDIGDALSEQADAATAPLKAQLEALQTARDLRKEETDEAEKLLAVEKARIALENAQNERPVRHYNAATGRWEWTSNAQTVEKAREDLQKAQAGLDEFYADAAYKKAAAEIEKQIENTEQAFKSFKSVWDDMTEAVKKGEKTLAEAFAVIESAMLIYGAEGGVNLSNAYALAAGGISSAGLSGASANGLTERMKANSAAWHSADGETRKRLEDENLLLGTAMGWHRSDGTWYDANGRPVYDGGGILSGRGGLKATGAAEMILPPNVTERMLRAEETGAFNALLRHMGIVTAAAEQASALEGGSTRIGIGTQHNGNVYQFGSITLNEQQARGMTVYDLAQMAGTLALHGG